MPTMLPRPEIAKELHELLAESTVEELVAQYNRIKKAAYGSYVRDAGSVKARLTEYIEIDRADAIMPLAEKNKKQEPVGYRFWYLSNSTGVYQFGQWFDLMVSRSAKRRKIVKVKLSANALKAMEELGI